MRLNVVIGAVILLCAVTGSCTREIRERGDDPGINKVTVYFKPDNSLFPNPERGLYTHRGYTSSHKPITVDELKRLRADQLTLVFMSYLLADFINTPLSDDMLMLIQNNFDALRSAGMKAVLRFAYSKSSSAVVYDANKEILLTHITQLKPLLEKNSDVIAVMEAGFIGAWGEWYYSTHYGNKSEPDYDKRRIILHALLEALPEERMISLRTPLFKVKMLNVGFDEALTVEEAYTQTYKARLSHHNDCFLANESDMGTYRIDGDRMYVAADSRYTCVGGETCSEPTTYSECTAAIGAMATYHWSYINVDYHKGILDDWVQKGCFEEIRRRLGYRFVLKQAEHPETTKAGSEYELLLMIDNDGFAAPFNPRLAELVFRSLTTGKIVYKHSLDADPRFWFGGETIRIKERLKLPEGMKADTYEVLLSLSDPMESLYERPEYAIRFANTDVWEESTGYNKLFEQVIIE